MELSSETITQIINQCPSILLRTEDKDYQIKTFLLLKISGFHPIINDLYKDINNDLVNYSKSMIDHFETTIDHSETMIDPSKLLGNSPRMIDRSVCDTHIGERPKNDPYELMDDPHELMDDPYNSIINSSAIVINCPSTIIDTIINFLNDEYTFRFLKLDTNQGTVYECRINEIQTNLFAKKINALISEDSSIFLHLLFFADQYEYYQLFYLLYDYFQRYIRKYCDGDSRLLEETEFLFSIDEIDQILNCLQSSSLKFLNYYPEVVKVKVVEMIDRFKNYDYLFGCENLNLFQDLREFTIYDYVMSSQTPNLFLKYQRPIASDGPIRCYLSSLLVSSEKIVLLEGSSFDSDPRVAFHLNTVKINPHSPPIHFVIKSIDPFLYEVYEHLGTFRVFDDINEFILPIDKIFEQPFTSETEISITTLNLKRGLAIDNDLIFILSKTGYINSSLDKNATGVSRRKITKIYSKFGNQIIDIKSSKEDNDFKDFNLQTVRVKLDQPIMIPEFEYLSVFSSL